MSHITGDDPDNPHREGSSEFYAHEMHQKSLEELVRMYNNYLGQSIGVGRFFVFWGCLKAEIMRRPVDSAQVFGPDRRHLSPRAVSIHGNTLVPDGEDRHQYWRGEIWTVNREMHLRHEAEQRMKQYLDLVATRRRAQVVWAWLSTETDAKKQRQMLVTRSLTEEELIDEVVEAGTARAQADRELLLEGSALYVAYAHTTRPDIARIAHVKAFWALGNTGCAATSPAHTALYRRALGSSRVETDELEVPRRLLDALQGAVPPVTARSL